MPTNVDNDTLSKPAISFCKKCNLEHEKPVGAKCEKAKAARDDKRDSSRDCSAVRKTPKNKSSGDMNDKMMDMVMTTMASVSEKLAAMDECITGLASCIEPTPEKSTRKSHSREQTKRRDLGDHDEALFGSPTNVNVIQEGRAAYAQTFPDTAVALKPTQTPAHAKKMKPEGTLGCTSLPCTMATLGSASTTVTDVIFTGCHTVC